MYFVPIRVNGIETVNLRLNFFNSYYSMSNIYVPYGQLTERYNKAIGLNS